jgi:hypothetical protein
VQTDFPKRANALAKDKARWREINHDARTEESLHPEHKLDALYFWRRAARKPPGTRSSRVSPERERCGRARGRKGICAFWPTLLTDEEKARRADWCSAQGRRDDACGLANGSCLHTDLPPGIPVRTNSKVHRVTPRREVVMVIS